MNKDKMLKIKENKIAEFFRLLVFWGLVFVFLTAIFGVGERAAADEIQNENSSANNSGLDAEIEEKEKELKEIEDKIETYENLVELKQKQQATLSNQIELMDEEIKKAQEQITRTTQEMRLVELEIKKIELSIQEKDIEIEYRKKILAELIRNLYRESRSNFLELILRYDNLADYFSQVERLNQVNDKTKEVLDDINQAKVELETKRDQRREKFDKMDSLKNDSLKDKQYLESEQLAKENLLNLTQGEEDKYQEMLGRFEEQREELLGNIDEMAVENSGELAQVKSKQKKPTSGLSSTRWYFSQKDSRWGGNNIGMSRTKMANYGCAVTCVAMVLKYHGISMDPGILAKQRIFYYDLIVWPEHWQDVERVSSTFHGNINWKTIDNEIESGNPVIVFIRASGRGAGHYVVVHSKDKKGEYVAHDPYWGANIYLDSTRDYIGALYGSKTSIDQMIIYHGKGGADKRTDKEKCKDSGGKWSSKKEKCACPKDYTLEDEECVLEEAAKEEES